MSGLFILPFLEAVGLGSSISAVAEGIVGVAAAETVGTVASGFIGGTIAGEVDKIVKSKLPAEIKEAPSRLYNDFSAAAKSLYTQNPSYLIENRVKSKGLIDRVLPPQPRQPGPQPNPSVQQFNAQTGTLQPGSSIDRAQPNQQLQLFNEVANDIKSTSLPIVQDGTLDRYKQIYNQLSTNSEIKFEPIVDDVFDPETTESSEVPPDPNGDELLHEKVYESAYEEYQYSPRDLARFVIDYSRELATTRNPIEALKNILEMNPSVYGLAKTVTGYLASKSVPNTSEYLEISKIYNFSNITYANFSIARNPETGLIETTFIDEIGEVHNLPQNTGLILPSVPGTTFMGPYSINNRLPTETRIEDWCSVDHDWFYAKEGFFSRTGDLRFISRLSACLQSGRVRPENRQLVESTIVYFSNVSLTLGAMFNRTDKNEPVPIKNEDIYQVIGSPEALGMEPVSDPEYLLLRDTFYDVMDEELITYTKSDGFFTFERNAYVESQVGNLEIQLN